MGKNKMGEKKTAWGENEHVLGKEVNKLWGETRTEHVHLSPHAIKIHFVKLNNDVDMIIIQEFYEVISAVSFILKNTEFQILFSSNKEINVIKTYMITIINKPILFITTTITPNETIS
ncbi:hypothetical protein Avbf_11940 [Armadillidium vulgare]|nr:hypothetical protein Avbf_11940 [Armadillidium vulgare]